MYISILDYNRQSIVIINDTENAMCSLQTDDVEDVLNTLGFHGSEISFMITDENPYQPVDEYVTLREMCKDVDEDDIEDLCRRLNLSMEDLTDGE